MDLSGKEFHSQDATTDTALSPPLIQSPQMMVSMYHLRWQVYMDSYPRPLLGCFQTMNRSCLTFQSRLCIEIHIEINIVVGWHQVATVKPVCRSRASHFQLTPSQGCCEDRIGKMILCIPKLFVGRMG